MLTSTQCLSQTYLCVCEKALCVVGNELVLVSVQLGVYLQAIGELMKEFPCCPAAKKKRREWEGKDKAGNKRPSPLSRSVWRTRSAQSQKESCFCTAEKPRATLTGGHPSVQTSFSTKGHPHRPPGNRHLGEFTSPASIFSWSFTCKGKATLSSSLLSRLQGESSLDLHHQLTSLKSPLLNESQIWLGSRKGPPSYLNSALKSSWQIPGMHQCKRKQILVCFYGVWIFYHGCQDGNTTVLKACAHWVETLQEQHKLVPDTRAGATASPNMHPSGILLQKSRVLFLWKVGNKGSE